MSDSMPLFQTVEIWSTKLVSFLTNLLNFLREIDFDDFAIVVLTSSFEYGFYKVEALKLSGVFLVFKYEQAQHITITI